MKTKDGFIQGYNAQTAVDATAQVIVALGLDANQTESADADGRGERGSTASRRSCRPTLAIAPMPI
jgi:hypothetical protein